MRKFRIKPRHCHTYQWRARRRLEIRTPSKHEAVANQIGTRALKVLASRIGSPRLDPRVGLHATMVAVAVSCAVAGGNFAVNPSLSEQGSPRAEIRVQAAEVQTGVAPAVQAMAASAASPGTAASVQVAPTPKQPVPAPIQAAPVPTKTPAAAADDPIRMALGLPDPASISKIEDGVVAARPMTSSRGSNRAPEAAPPKPSPTPVPTAEPTPSPAPKKDFKIQTYKVEDGDTLLDIATKFGITPETVLWANDIRSADLLQIGQELRILPVPGVLHTVQPGETLGGIADAYVAERAKIIEVNTIPNPDNLQEGQVLIIPGGMRRTTEITGLPAAPSAQELASAAKYTVKDGDTLLSIADAFGVRISTIQVANDLLNPDMLKVGLVLAIPGGAQQAPAPAAPAPRPAPAAKPAPAPKPQPAPAPAPPPPPVSGDKGDQIAAIAQQYVGYRYVWGGTSPSGFDCSGFVWYVYKQAGLSIPRAPLQSQLASGARVSRDQLLPGDVIFWANTYTAGISHVGIYLGGGRFINAETERVGVQIRSLNDPYWSARYYGASRPW